MLVALPSELLDMVIGQIVSRGDLKRLCEVCTRLHDIAIPHLYRSLVLSAPELSLQDLAQTLDTIPWKHLKHTEELGFSAPIHDRVESRCVHHDGNGSFIDEAIQDGLAESFSNDEFMDYESLDGENRDESTDRVNKDTSFPTIDNCKSVNQLAQSRTAGSLFDLSCALNSLEFPDNKLRSFRWELGTCIPETLFCGSNSFLRNQRHIQSITFITDGECGASKNFVDLVRFTELRSLSWSGLNQFNDFESVRECIKFHGHQIQSLTLDLLTWVRAEKIWADGSHQQTHQTTRIPDNFFSQRVLNIHPQDQKVIFLSLENLHLSAVSFCHTGMEMAHAFNVGLLKSLKLRNCPGSLNWLRMILDSGKPMKLRSFELALDFNSLERDAYLYISETICNFIQQISDLETLYLTLPEPIDWTALTDRLSSHRHLKRFVMHHLVDRGGQYLIDGDIPWPDHLEQILQGDQLACFGSSIPPRDLVSHLQRMQPKPSCKLIHFRTSGVVLDRLIKSGQPSSLSTSLYTYKYGDDLPYKPEDVYDFARWAFSADGLPSLQVLAWGDFSYGGRYSEFNLLLCKSDIGYRTLNPSDIVSWNLVQENMDMLEACPLDDILE